MELIEEDLEEIGFTPIDILVKWGVTEEQWDCYINHYSDYDWDELINATVVEYFITLGWNQESWETKDPDLAPKSEFREVRKEKDI